MNMATGDVKNNLKKLHGELKKIKLPQENLDLEKLLTGNPESYLPIYDYLFQWFSTPLAQLINERGLKPPSYQEDKARFTDTIYLILRDIFSWKPPITLAQFNSNGFVERKVIMCTEVVKMVKDKHQELSPKSSIENGQSLVAHCGIKMIKKNLSTSVNVASAKTTRMSNGTTENHSKPPAKMATRNVKSASFSASNGTADSKLQEFINKLTFLEEKIVSFEPALNKKLSVIEERLLKIEEVVNGKNKGSPDKIAEIVPPTPVAAMKPEVPVMNNIVSSTPLKAAEATPPKIAV